MSSVSSSSGAMQISVTFAVGTDADVAQVNVNNRVQAATPMLPEIVRQSDADVFILLGAGDLESYAPQITEVLEER